MFLKTLLLFSLIVIIAMAGQLTLDEQWAKFKTDNGKTYEGEEEARRFEIFKDNVKFVEEHNKKYDAGEVSYKLGINQFSDLSHDEFRKFSTGVRLPDKN